MLKSAQSAVSVSEWGLAPPPPRPGAELWASQGRSCVELGDLFGALQCFQRSLESDLDCHIAWLGLSDVFRTMNDRRRADACLDVARRIRARAKREATA